MLTAAAAQDLALALVERARAAGADAADAVYGGGASDSVTVRLGKLEDVERSESEHVDLRVFVGKRSASIGSSDLSDYALSELAQRAVAMARLAPEDPYSGLAPRERLLTGAAPDLDLVDAHEPSADQLRERAAYTEEAARAVHGVTNSEGAAAGAGRNVFALATSDGFARSYEGTSHSLSASVIAGEGGAMQRDYAWRSAHHASDLITPGEIGRMAGVRAVSRLNPGRLKSGLMSVIFAPRVGGSLVGHLLGAMNGGAIARGSSFLRELEGARVLPEDITIIDDPLRRRGLRSRPFDGEGAAVAARALVKDGVLGEWLMDSAAARQLGRQPTGQAVRGGGGAPGAGASNVHMEAGSMSPAELMSGIADGVYVTELIGQGVNGVTGDYSRGAAGFRIVGGEPAEPVAEFTIAGNLIDMFKELSAADDLEWHRAVNVPTLRVDGMTVAGD